jgi:hypothetical protein
VAADGRLNPPRQFALSNGLTCRRVKRPLTVSQGGLLVAAKKRVVVIHCPETGKEINTGFYCDDAQWQATAFDTNALVCRFCRRVHTWTKEHARFRDDRAHLEVPDAA